MIRLSFFAVAAIVVLGVAAPASQAGVQVGVSADQDGINSFYLAIGEQYRVPEREVVVVRDRKVPDDELPVVFFLARRARVEPGVIVDLRLGGQSWMDIALHYHLSPEIFYVHFDRDPGPPYGRAWGYYKNHKRAEWGKIRLADDDIVNVVNLKFMSERYGCAPSDVVQRRAKGDDFVVINGEFRAKKDHGKHDHNSVASSEHSKGKSNGKGHGKGHGSKD